MTINRLQKGLYYSALKPLQSTMPGLMVWACRNLKGIPPYIRVEKLYSLHALPRPYYFLGIKRAYDDADRLGLTRFSILEFGVAEGNGILMLQSSIKNYATKPSNQNKQVKILGFDTFEGLPDIDSSKDGQSTWKTGDFPSDLNLLRQFIDPELVELHKGLFANTIPQAIQTLIDYPPLFIIVDCDLYTSTVDIFNGLFPKYVPELSYWFFDDTNLNYYAEDVGETLAIEEFNSQQDNPFCFIPDYAAMREPVPLDIALKHCYNCINSQKFIDHKRQGDVDVPQRLPLDVDLYNF